MSGVLRVPQEAGYFEGHFPGRPILPGVALLALVADALAQGPVRRVLHARFRLPVGPGETLALDARSAAGGNVRVVVTRNGLPVMSAELAFDAPGSPSSSTHGRSAPLPAPPFDELLPHRPPMRFVHAVLDRRDDGIACAAAVPAGCGLARAGRAPALATIEAAAQAAAVWEALSRRAAGGPAEARAGYLVGLRDVALHAPQVPADAEFTVAVRLEEAAMPLTHYRAEAVLDGIVVMTGTFATVLARGNPDSGGGG
jgi:predicted hotdog family 3-hydroxylacyl-ACP dehydratase